MHPASAFHEADTSSLARIVGERGFASIVGVERGRALTAAAPVILAGGTASFHLSSRNALAPILAEARWALAIVLAEDAYVSPDWYAAADQVPTWNYRSVEIEGALRVLDLEETAGLLDALSLQFEQKLAPKPPWSRDKMRPSVFEGMLRAITGFEMSIERFEGTIKLSQNKPGDEIARVAAKLAEQPDARSQAVAALMTARSETPPSTANP